MEPINIYTDTVPDEWEKDGYKELHSELKKVEEYPLILGKPVFREVWLDGDTYWFLGERELTSRDLKRLLFIAQKQLK
jgi:hypothetical protein